MNSVRGFIVASVASALAAIGGCGGGSGGGLDSVAGIGGTGKIASGTITGFGSIFVNGVEYDIDTASIEINDDVSVGLGQDDLRIGMVVTVSAVVEGSSGIASRVVYDSEVEGPVSRLSDEAGGLAKSFSVLGLNVLVDIADTEFDDGEAPGFSFATMANGDVVEISGFFDGSNVLNATYIKKIGDFQVGTSEAEIKGRPDAGTDAGAGDSFTIDGVTVNILAAADLSEVTGERVTDSMFVEIEGRLTNDNPPTIDALRIEQEEEGLDEDAGEAELEGLVSSFVDDSNFTVAGQRVDASDAEFKPAGLVLSDGLRVEVEGAVEGGILKAGKVELED
jgi:hypothetical protein